ncbi:PEP-utilizing enzyme [Saccharothrix syringae]|uniref:Phosphoenolpyruvate synthase n=1 Tax=Saccharothrix syringae TaxID=103733 RepID=A0A5Q0H388_SACSY|nr:PEP-utilizing enzyme [Saccharothrix syringae]QFZ20671.1 hypothetical protein EKG83_27645 [Saccharothrix syringae]
MTGLVRVTAGADARESFGGKVVGLAALLAAGLAVPDTWVLPVGAELDAADVADLAGRAPRWAVRSSASVEDDAGLSYAGLFRTELDVPADAVPDAVARVRASVADGRVAAYRDRVGAGAGGVAMAVALQPYRPPSRSGLWIGRRPGAGRLEWTDGSGERLVGGAVTPRWEEWAEDGRTADSGEVFAVGGDPVGAACLAAQHALGAAADLELAVVGNSLLWLQFRPVTAPLGPAAGESPVGRVVRGVAAAPGRAVAPALRAHDPFDDRWRPGLVLLTERTDPDWTPVLAEAAALVTAHGGMLCHTAIVARELGIPCVTGVGEDALEHLAGGYKVAVDGAIGAVSVITRESAGATGG